MDEAVYQRSYKMLVNLLLLAGVSKCHIYNIGPCLAPDWASAPPAWPRARTHTHSTAHCGHALHGCEGAFGTHGLN